MTTCNHPGPTCTCRKQGLGTTQALFDANEALYRTEVERDSALAAVERVREYHSRIDTGLGEPWCEADGIHWPCPTIETLDGDDPE